MKSWSKFFAQAAVGSLALAAASGANAKEGYFLGGYGATQTAAPGSPIRPTRWP